MKKFAFPLERVLRWREQQAEVEEERLRALFSESARIRAGIADLEDKRAAAERALVSFSIADSGQLAALDAWRLHLRNEHARLEGCAESCARGIHRQQQAVLEARRRHRLLERLRERVWRTWQSECDREQEQIAADVHLAIHHRPPDRSRPR